MVDAVDSKSSVERRVGSSPTLGTKYKKDTAMCLFLLDFNNYIDLFLIFSYTLYDLDLGERYGN